MFHKIISAIGLGVLGIDPITAVYLLSMGIRKEKKSRITLFFLTFALFSVLGGAVLAAVFGATAVEYLKRILPNDNSPIWAVLEFAISIVIFVWVIRKLVCKNRKAEDKKKNAIVGSWVKYFTTGFVFAVTCLTDPTYYAIILMGGETGNFFSAILLFTIWFLVSQFMAVIVYIAYQLNLLNKLTSFVNRLKEKQFKHLVKILYLLLLITAVVLLVDTGYYLFFGKYLF